MWYNPTTNTKAITHSEIRSANPQVSMPTELTDENIESGGFYPLTAVTPAHDPLTQSVREIAPALSALNKYEQRWEIVELDAETIAANQASAHKSSITGQIATLEASITNRRIREAIRGSGKQWLDDIDDQITVLRAQL